MMCLPHWSLPGPPWGPFPQRPATSLPTKTCLGAVAICVQLCELEELHGVLKFLFKGGLGKGRDSGVCCCFVLLFGFRCERTGTVENKARRAGEQGNLPWECLIKSRRDGAQVCGGTSWPSKEPNPGGVGGGGGVALGLVMSSLTLSPSPGPAVLPPAAPCTPRGSGLCCLVSDMNFLS